MSRRAVKEDPGAFSGTDPIALTPADTKRVSGGGANVRHDNPGGGPTPYNMPGSPDYEPYMQADSAGPGV